MKWYVVLGIAGIIMMALSLFILLYSIPNAERFCKENGYNYTITSTGFSGSCVKMHLLPLNAEMKNFIVGSDGIKFEESSDNNE